jgi:cAMP-dependent protein kinase regulator
VVQGDPGDRFYVVESGSADVLVDGFLVGFVGDGGAFGEKALLRDVPRTATVRSRTPMTLSALSREHFLGALTGRREGTTSNSGGVVHAGPSDWTRRERIEILAHVSLLSHLDARALADLAERSIVERWDQGAVLIRRGEPGDRFYVVLRGRAVVSRDGADLSQLYPGDQFGEIALLHGVPRTADVTAIGSLVTLSLHRDDFVAAIRDRVVLG